jgi:hypothetical protein
VECLAEGSLEKMLKEARKARHFVEGLLGIKENAC